MTRTDGDSRETAARPRSDAPRPVFVVGVPRSGTTLLAAMLARSETHACGPETHVLSLLDDTALARFAGPDRWPTAAVDALAVLRGGGIELLEAYGVDRAELTAALADEDPSERALVAALPKLHASRHGKRGWIEKTPGHLQHAARLRRLFPEAAIVQIVRDPRDVARSLTRVPWASDCYLANVYLWRERRLATRELIEADPNAHVVRYEDLVRDPATTLRDLCDRLGSTYREEMLDPTPAASQVATAEETWKEGVARPLDASRAGAWRHEVAPETAHAAGIVCQELLRELGYDAPDAPATSIALSRCDRRFVEEHEPRIVTAAGEGIRYLPATAATKHEAVLSCLSPPAGTRSGRARHVGRFVAAALRRRLRGDPWPYLVDLPARGAAATCKRIALRLLGRPVNLAQPGAPGAA